MTHDLMIPSRRGLLGAGLATAFVPTLAVAQTRRPLVLLNASYDPTRELYKAVNTAYAAYWKRRINQDLTINQSHGGSSAQARAVIGGLDADVVTLSVASDIDEIAARRKLLPADWQSRLPNNSTPYTSTIIFLVRKGNPKNIRDWGDLVKPGVAVVTPNPKTGGGARWNYLAAWAWAQKNGRDPQAFVAELYRHVPVLDSGARGSTTTFVQRGIGDVLLSWENEAYLAVEELGPGKVDIVYPSLSILAEPPVALVDKVVDRKGTRAAATGYLNFLYSPIAQDIIGRNHYRPRDAKALAKHRSRFKDIPLVTIDGQFGGWKKTQPLHFGDGGIFDKIYRPR